MTQMKKLMKGLLTNKTLLWVSCKSYKIAKKEHPLEKFPLLWIHKI